MTKEEFRIVFDDFMCWLENEKYVDDPSFSYYLENRSECRKYLDEYFYEHSLSLMLSDTFSLRRRAGDKFLADCVECADYIRDEMEGEEQQNDLPDMLKF